MAVTLGRAYGEKMLGVKPDAIVFNLLINVRRGVKPLVHGSSYQQSAINYVGIQYPLGICSEDNIPQLSVQRDVINHTSKYVEPTSTITPQPW